MAGISFDIECDNAKCLWKYRLIVHEMASLRDAFYFFHYFSISSDGIESLNTSKYLIVELRIVKLFSIVANYGFVLSVVSA